MIEARGVYLFVGQGSKRTEAFIPIAVQTQQNQYAFSENILTASIKKKQNICEVYPLIHLCLLKLHIALSNLKFDSRILVKHIVIFSLWGGGGGGGASAIRQGAFI